MNRLFLISLRLSLMAELLLVLTLQALPRASAQTIVQFKTPLGTMDVELFDKDKPVTVANFLNYVTNGVYKDMFLHRWVPGFVIQGGGFAVARRGTTNAQFTLFKNFGTITNEYGVGQKRSNVYGTIAMAKLGNDPNSASSEWFFNLADNSANLDNQNGGFTVFGHVIAGTDVLQRFNPMDAISGVFAFNLTSVTPAFSNLPFISTNLFTASDVYSNLVYAEIVVVSKGSAPVITAQPQPQQVIAGDPAQFSVSASGSQTLRYQWSLNDVPIPNETNAVIRIPETATAQAGSYSVRVVNDIGFVTSIEARLDVRLKLTTKIVGSGAITREPDQPDYAAGVSITLQAKPTAGWRFSRWDGASNSTAPVMLVTLLANQTVTAVFEQIPVQPFAIGVSGRNTASIDLSAPGLDRAVYEFETSFDLRSWAPWLRVTNTSGVLKVTDPRGVSSPALFYRGKFTGFTE